jgi:hypothetical protein
MAVTEHNHRLAEQGASPDRKDELLIGKDHTLYDQLIADASTANMNGSFVGRGRLPCGWSERTR